LIQTGKISKKSWKRTGRGYLIDRAKAEQDMRDNITGWAESELLPSDELERYLEQPMDIIPADDGPASRVKIQEQAADIASEGEEPFPGGYSHPTPIWDIRYIAALWDLDPESVTVEQITKTKWRLTIADIDNQDFEPCPWAVNLSFNLNPDQVED
jgi:hypothetical protein